MEVFKISVCMEIYMANFCSSTRLGSVETLIHSFKCQSRPLDTVVWDSQPLSSRAAVMATRKEYVFTLVRTHPAISYSACQRTGSSQISQRSGDVWDVCLLVIL